MKTRCTYKTFLAGMLVFILISILNFDYSYATESTLSLSIDNSAVKVNVAPTSTNGTFRKGTASTISASTDNATGYTLSISAPSASGSDYDKLINTSDNTARINSISSPTTEEQYKALNNTSYNNTWGYLPSKYCSDGTSSTCATNTDFLPAPTITGDVLDQTTSANSTANTYTIGMGTRIDSNTKTGKYTNSFVVKLVANAIPYTMIFDDGVVSDMPTDIDSTSMTSTVSIPNQTPSREGYTFLGWCSVAVTTNNGIDSCSGTTYQPNSTVTINQTGANNDFHFHAMWSKITQSSCPASPMITTVAPSITYMQNINSSNSASVLSTLATNATYQIKDSRDRETYCVAKLADGKLWLLDNLALDLTNEDTLAIIDETNTNIDTTNDPGAIAALKGISVRNPDADASGKYATAKVANSTSSTDTSYSVPLVNLTNKDVIPTDATSTAGGYKVGGYYNYCAATAGSYCYGNGTSAGTSSGNATSDICPKGWRMPTGNTSGEYSALANAIYGSTGETSDATAYANYRSTLRLPLSGVFGSGSASYRGSVGLFWSLTHSSSFSMYLLYLSTSYIDPARDNSRSNEYSVRCVLGS